MLCYDECCEHRYLLLSEWPDQSNVHEFGLSSCVSSSARKRCILNFLRNNFLFLFVLVKSLPWNQETLKGRFITIAFQNGVTGLYFCIITLFLSAFLTVILQFDAYRMHFEELLREMNQEDDSFGVATKKSLEDAIRFHVLVKE